MKFNLKNWVIQIDKYLFEILLTQLMQILEVTFSIDFIHSLTTASLPAANQELRPNLLTDLMIQPPNVQMEELRT